MKFAFKKSMINTVVGVAAIAASVTAFAADPVTPVTLAGGKVIDVATAKKLADSKTAFFVDTRSVVNFGKGHVPGAKAIPYKGDSENTPNFDSSKDQFDLAKLPADKAQAVVFYSDGPTGWKSYKAAVTAVKGGYKNVSYMRDGWNEWTAKGFTAEN